MLRLIEDTIEPSLGTVRKAQIAFDTLFRNQELQSCRRGRRGEHADIIVMDWT
jgi:hypothetical protein